MFNEFTGSNLPSTEISKIVSSEIQVRSQAHQFPLKVEYGVSPYVKLKAKLWKRNLNRIVNAVLRSLEAKIYPVSQPYEQLTLFETHSMKIHM